MRDLVRAPIPRPTKREKKPKVGLKSTGKNKAPTDNVYKDRSLVQENSIAETLTKETGIPFQRNIGSGAFKETGSPGDVSTSNKVRVPSHRWILELKAMGTKTARGEKTATFKIDHLKQVVKEGELENKIPALLFQYAEAEGMETDPEIWFVCQLEVFMKLLAEHKEMYDTIERITSGSPVNY